jgi:large subunit ribosomal protein L23
MTANPRDLLMHYLTTEKNTVLKDSGNVYVFEVARRANKKSIRSAVEQIFSVHVENVNIAVAPHKPKRLGRFAGRRPGYKKAYVRLKAGESIEVYENV